MEGVFTGHTEPSQGIVVTTTSGSSGLLDGTGDVGALTGADYARIQSGSELVDEACSKSSGDCWRINQPAGLIVERSTDGSTIWQSDYVMASAERDDLVDRIGERCGEPARVGMSDLAVLDGAGGPVVAVAFGSGGVLVRRPDGDWRRIRVGGRGLVLASPTPTPTPTGQPPTAPEGLIVPLGEDVPPGPRQTTIPSSTAPDCPSPTTHVITPDLRNGPPVTVTRCP